MVFLSQTTSLNPLAVLSLGFQAKLNIYTPSGARAARWWGQTFFSHPTVCKEITCLTLYYRECVGSSMFEKHMLIKIVAELTGITVFLFSVEVYFSR